MGKEIKMNQGNMNQQQQIQLNPNDLEDIICDKCGCQTFQSVFLFKKLSAVLSPTGKDTLVPMQTYKCTDCGHINQEFLPKDKPDA
tara:strand:- start:1320 stop:1577 length:258 start_codon:yes stop_codon:yes gene_type:complete